MAKRIESIRHGRRAPHITGVARQILPRNTTESRLPLSNAYLEYHMSRDCLGDGDFPELLLPNTEKWILSVGVVTPVTSIIAFCGYNRAVMGN